MADNNSTPKRRKKRRLTPQEKYQVWCEVLGDHGSQRDIADRWGIDRSTVVAIVKIAKQGALDRLALSKPGRPSKTTEQLALEEAEAELERLRATITEQAVELHLFRGKGGWD